MLNKCSTCRSRFSTSQGNTTAKVLQQLFPLVFSCGSAIHVLLVAKQKKQNRLTHGSSCFGCRQVGAVSDPKHVGIPVMLKGLFVDVQPATLISQWGSFNHRVGSHWRSDMKHLILTERKKEKIDDSLTENEQKQMKLYNYDCLVVAQWMFRYE